MLVGEMVTTSLKRLVLLTFCRPVEHLLNSNSKVHVTTWIMAAFIAGLNFSRVESNCLCPIHKSMMSIDVLQKSLDLY